jgi:hypothetical protein
MMIVTVTAGRTSFFHDERAMGAAQEATPGRDLSAAAGAAGGYPQAGRRDENAGNSDGRGPSDPAGDASSDEPGLGTGLLQP